MNKRPQRFKERTPLHKAMTWAQGEVGQLEGARTLITCPLEGWGD